MGVARGNNNMHPLRSNGQCDGRQAVIDTGAGHSGGEGDGS